MGSVPARVLALSHVRARAEDARAAARERIAKISSRTGEPQSAIDALLPRLRDHASVTLNFHPDRLAVAGGRTVIEGLLHEGRYRSQSARCTLTWGDSHEGPEHVGTIDAFEPLLAALLEAADASGEALGVSGMDVGTLVRSLSSTQRGGARGVQGRALDTYIEAQVHGDIDLSADVDALVVDPSFEGTSTGASLHELCARYGIAFREHPGFVLATQDVPDDFRGPRMVPLAERVDRCFALVRGQLDAATVGRAAQALQREPESWQDWGTFEESLQHIKQLWHVLVRFGRARAA